MSEGKILRCAQDKLRTWHLSLFVVLEEPFSSLEGKLSDEGPGSFTKPRLGSTARSFATLKDDKYKRRQDSSFVLRMTKHRPGDTSVPSA
jgi:hypothetical protein